MTSLSDADEQWGISDTHTRGPHKHTIHTAAVETGFVASHVVMSFKPCIVITLFDIAQLKKHDLHKSVDR
jgi:hypothetical protein